MGWSEIRNGELLRLAAAQFDVFVTVDRKLSFQNRIAEIPMAVVVLCAQTNRLADLRALVPDLQGAIASAIAATVTNVGQ